MPAFDAAAALQLAGGTVRLGAFLFVESDPPLRLTTGFGDRRLAADAIDTTGGVYLGTGELIGMPAINQLLNGVAQRIELTLSGKYVTSEVVEGVELEAGSVRDAAAHLGFVAYDQDWAPLFDVLWLIELTVDVVKTMESATSGSVTLSASSEHMNRRRPRAAFYTGPDQRRLHADDAGCDRVVLYSANTTVRWPT
jgi:hypothetical protein